jgi:hypothetical protein
MFVQVDTAYSIGHEHGQALQHGIFGPPPAMAALFQDDKEDTIDPFTLYGSTRCADPTTIDNNDNSALHYAKHCRQV